MKKITLGAIVAGVDDALELFLKQPLDLTEGGQMAIWRKILARDEAATLAMPAALVQLLVQNAVVFDAPPDNAADWEVPVVTADQAIETAVADVRRFWTASLGDQADKFDMLIDLPSNRIEAIVFMVDAPGPIETVRHLSHDRIMSLPLETLNVIGNMHGMFCDEETINEAVDTILAEIDAGTLDNEHTSIEARLKVLMDTDMLVDP